MTRFTPTLLLLLATAAGGPAADLDGVWLFDAATSGKLSKTDFVWRSKLSVVGRSFALSRFADAKADLKGTFAFDPADPRHIDITTDGLDLSPTGLPLKVPATTWLGLYERNGDRLTVTFDRRGGRRPAGFGETGDTIISLSLVKAPPGFTAFPKEVAVRVTAPDGKPAAGATVSGPVVLDRTPETGTDPPAWKSQREATTGSDGVARVKYTDLRFHATVVRDPATGRVATFLPTPAGLASGQAAITLQPGCKVSGTAASEVLTESGRSIGQTLCLVHRDGRSFAYCRSAGGRFEFVLPPGDYVLRVMGQHARDRTVPVTVPPGASELDVGPIDLPSAKLLGLEGRPAPELTGVVGWKGTPVTLAGLRGKVVVLDFWGYWCGSCVQDMPVLFDLHARYADKGLVVVGVHVDSEGEVDTAAKLDEKLTDIRKELWKGKDIPFPVALASGERVGEGDDRRAGGLADRYGVTSFPETILIGRDGTVIGRFSTRDPKAAAERIEKLLAEPK